MQVSESRCEKCQIPICFLPFFFKNEEIVSSQGGDSNDFGPKFAHLKKESTTHLGRTRKKRVINMATSENRTGKEPLLASHPAHLGVHTLNTHARASLQITHMSNCSHVSSNTFKTKIAKYGARQCLQAGRHTRRHVTLHLGLADSMEHSQNSLTQSLKILPDIDQVPTESISRCCVPALMKTMRRSLKNNDNSGQTLYILYGASHSIIGATATCNRTLNNAHSYTLCTKRWAPSTQCSSRQTCKTPIRRIPETKAENCRSLQLNTVVQQRNVLPSPLGQEDQKKFSTAWTQPTESRSRPFNLVEDVESDLLHETCHHVHV